VQQNGFRKHQKLCPVATWRSGHQQPGNRKVVGSMLGFYEQCSAVF
jgi:hypothetical protein